MAHSVEKHRSCEYGAKVVSWREAAHALADVMKDL